MGFSAATYRSTFPRDAYHRSPSLAIRRGDWKLLVNPDGTNAELYDLSKDANETQNLAAEHPGLTEELSKPPRLVGSAAPASTFKRSKMTPTGKNRARDLAGLLSGASAQAAKPQPAQP